MPLELETASCVAAFSVVTPGPGDWVAPCDITADAGDVPAAVPLTTVHSGD